MAVADVPAVRLARAGNISAIGDLFTDLLTATLLSDDLLSVGVQDGGHVQGGFLHVANIRDAAGFGKRCGQCAEWFGGIAKGAGVL